MLRARFFTALASIVMAPLALAQGLGSPEIRSQALGDGFHVLFGPGAGNMLVSIGDSGVLLVDDGVPAIVDAYRARIVELGGGDIDLAINTHWHFDHADGNQVLGPDGVQLVAHENSRQMMMQDNLINLVSQTFDQPAYAPEAWPEITYDTTMRIHFNGERIDLMHFGPAHTTGDTAVIFRDRNLVHLGDVFNMGGYPFIDADNGGSLEGLIAFCERVLAEIEPGATVIPGHGGVSDYQGLADYIAMLSEIRDSLSSLIEDGASLEQIVAAGPTADWDEVRGDPMMLLNRAYASMTGGETP
ncbi:MAG TPA: MBL fold metallo-hydrolase [Gammaproteobacteria bacterium]|jgi:glyoxylase-like metal-dependent hydrolase (beta-lactamase superfamily II)